MKKKMIIFFYKRVFILECQSLLIMTLIAMQWHLITIDNWWINTILIEKEFANSPNVHNVFQNPLNSIILAYSISFVRLP